MSATEALLLIGHGSARYPAAGAVMHHHAAALRDGGGFAQVEVAVLNGAPSVAEALGRIDAACVRVVPFFMEDGYFSRVAVPKAVAVAGMRTILCDPVGVHEAMAEIVARQGLAGCADLAVAPRDAAVVLVGHGSSSAPGRALALHRHAAAVAALEVFARVEAACLEEAPFVGDVLGELQAHAVVVIGFFANRGGHVRDDVPALIAAARAARGKDGPDVRFQGSVTDDPAMIRIILDQAGKWAG